MKIYRALGLMSGTSLDGIDAALIRTDGESHVTHEGFVTLPYDNDLREALRACFGKTDRAEMKTTEELLTAAHADAVHRLLSQYGAAPSDIDLVGFHGQTVFHAPARRLTCQIGDGALLARMTGIKVVNDFRSADVRAGGQGAPLVPVYHRALAARLEKPVIFLNIGGVANITYVGAGEELIAFDTGPGNALVDDWMREKTGTALDQDGAAARAGRVDGRALQRLLAHPYFSALPPKSLDRNAFSPAPCAALSVADGAATLTAFTVAAVAQAERHVPIPPRRWIVAGGGRHNAAMMEALRARLSSPVVPIEDLGHNGDAIEAEAFAYLAVRSVRGLPFSFPGTTGVPRPMTGGHVWAAA